jgi:hypothetical protein
MRSLLVLVVILFSFSLFADSEVSTQVNDIDMGLVNEDPLIFLSSGQVVTYPAGDKAFYAKLREGIKNKVWFHLTINDSREITALKEIAAPLPRFDEIISYTSEELTPYTPSILKDLDQARSFFYDARATHKESQCFNRAHVWTYEWRTKRNLYASKVWLFFTRKFIRKYKFEWWFHVAPMVNVVVDGSVKERVMDIKYAKGPLKLKQWTDIFMRDNADCPVVQKYSDHANYPESGSCFVMKSSMYYYQPIDLEELDVTGKTKSRWLEPEVKNAFLEAFDEKI